MGYMLLFLMPYSGPLRTSRPPMSGTHTLSFHGHTKTYLCCTTLLVWPKPRPSTSLRDDVIVIGSYVSHPPPFKPLPSLSTSPLSFAPLVPSNVRRYTSTFYALASVAVAYFTSFVPQPPLPLTYPTPLPLLYLIPPFLSSYIILAECLRENFLYASHKIHVIASLVISFLHQGGLRHHPYGGPPRIQLHSLSP